MEAVLCTPLFPESVERSLKGGTIAVRELVEQAREFGLEINKVIKFPPFISRKGLKFPKRLQMGEITVYEVPRIGIGKLYSTALTRRLMWMLGGDINPDVVVVHMTLHFASARRIFTDPDTRFVFVVHSGDFHHNTLKTSLTQSHRVLARSFAVAEQLRRLTGHECDGIVYSGIREEEFCEYTSKRFDHETLRVVMASKFVPSKNIEPALEAVSMVAKNRPVSVALYGDGALRSAVQNAIERLGLNDIVTCYGFRPRREVLDAMSAADLFLMPSTNETLGLAYLEAMANGCVVVGLRGWGIDGIVTDGLDGFLAETSVPGDIAEKIEAYLTADRKMLHDRAYALAREYTARKAAQNYADHIQQVMTCSAS